MSVLDGIEKSEIRNLLGKGWLTHDGMWFYNIWREFGVEKANAVNRAAIRSMAPFEVSRMKRTLDTHREPGESAEGLVQFLQAALELTLPDSVFRNFQISLSAKNLIRWKWVNGQCFAYKGIKQMGAIEGYHCGVIYRMECWLEALGVRYAVQPDIEGCLMHERGACEGEMHVFRPLESQT